MWINLRCKYITRDGQTIRVGRGDPIPEAEFWPNRDRLERTRFIRWIPDAETPRVVPIKAEVAKEEKPVIEEKAIEEDKPKSKKRGRPKKVDVE